MEWMPVKYSLQPVAGEAWYVTNGTSDVMHCGTGDEGKERAERIAKLLSLGQAARIAHDSKFCNELMEELKALNNAALHFDPEIVQNIPKGHPMYDVLLGVRAIKRSVENVQKVILMGPRQT